MRKKYLFNYGNKFNESYNSLGKFYKNIYLLKQLKLRIG